MNEDVSNVTDQELEPSSEPKSSKPWLNLITDAEKAFEDYQQRADNIDKLYASLQKLANDARDRQFQLFWANVEVLKPSIYSRPPVPVVTPKFKDRRPLYRVASEMLERCSVVTFDKNDINSVMLLIRDDLAIQARGVAWVRYETKESGEYDTEKVCIEHIDRKDFLHEPARNWLEVGWVARRGWLTKKEMKERFSKHSGDVYLDAEYAVQKEDRDRGAADRREKCGVWEIWSKTENKVVWVTPGVDVLLDEGAPHLKLDGFFPCPRPAYGTLQRRSLVPVPDFLFFKDQLEEVNDLTGRIHALADAVKVRGFYPAGSGEIGDAIEAAVKSVDRGQVMIPVSNWAAFGNGAPKDAIVWLPIEIIAQTVQALVELRRQIIDDVYQITGLSDIMRGSTEKEETATAQQLKAQYGSVRIRDKQAELVRIARDLERIAAEIMAEKFDPETLLAMSQMEIPTGKQIAEQVKAIQANAAKQFQDQVQQAVSNPQVAQEAQSNPQAAEQKLDELRQQIMGQAQEQIEKLKQTPTLEQVIGFLRDNRVRPFVLDIETDSTIQPDENAEKQRRTEFMQVLGSTIRELGALVQAQPQAAKFAGEALKFAVAPFRAGRELEASIEEFADQMARVASNPPPNPEAEKAKAEMAMKEREIAAREKETQTRAQIETAKADGEMNLKLLEHQGRMRELEAKMLHDQQKHQAEMEKLQIELQAKREEIEIKRESAQIDAQAKQQQAVIAAQSAQQKADIQAQQAEQQAEQSEAAFQQKSALAKQQAEARMKNGIAGRAGG